MVAARLAQVIERSRRTGRQLQIELLVVKDSERIDPQPAAGIRREARLVVAEVVDQGLAEAGRQAPSPIELRCATTSRTPTSAKKR